MQAKPRLEWRPQARADLLEIVAYIADDNPDAGQELKDEIEAKAAKLSTLRLAFGFSQRKKQEKIHRH